MKKLDPRTLAKNKIKIKIKIKIRTKNLKFHQ